MRRWTWVVFALSAIAVAIAFAVLPIGINRNNDKSFAHVITGTPGVNLPHLELDMVQDAGGTWCNPVDPVANHLQSEVYKVAVCLTSAPSVPSAFQFNLAYNTALNQCNPVVCDELDPNCLDSNPDANAAHTGGTIFNGTGLGTKWNCNIGDVSPDCGATSGQAFIQCNMTSGTGTLTLPVGPNVSWPIAVVSFTAMGVGVDDLTLQNVEVDDNALLPYVQCFGASCNAGAVFGATDYKGVTPTPAPPTATFTPVLPTATFTPTPVPPTATPTSTPVVTASPTATATPSQCLDIDGDGRVTGRDVSIVARALFSRPGQPRWNPVADVNHDGRVDLRDLLMVVRSLLNPVCHA